MSFEKGAGNDAGSDQIKSARLRGEEESRTLLHSQSAKDLVFNKVSG